MFGSGQYVLFTSCAIFSNVDYPSPLFFCKTEWYVFFIAMCYFHTWVQFHQWSKPDGSVMYEE